MRRPTHPLDPNDAYDYERDMEGYEHAQDDAADRDKDDEPLNDKEDE